MDRADAGAYPTLVAPLIKLENSNLSAFFARSWTLCDTVPAPLHEE